MIRTRIREDQSLDSDFLSEEEGAERFVFQDGYGTNNNNIVLTDGYSVKIDGYWTYPLKISETLGSTEVFSVKEIEFNDSYGFHVIDAGAGKVRIDFGSSFNPIYVPGQDTLDAAGEEPLQVLAGNGVEVLTDILSSPKALLIHLAGYGGASFLPVIKIGTTTLGYSYRVGEWMQISSGICTFVISVSFIKAGTGDLSIEGLPYPSRSVANLTQTFPVSFTGVVVANAYGTNQIGGDVMAVLSQNSTILKFRRTGSATNLTEASLEATTTMNITGTYLTE